MITSTKATSKTPSKTFPLITKREKHVLYLVSLGMSSIEIAAQLFVSEETVKTHRKNMRRKLDACNGASLVRTAFEFGYLELAKQY